MYWGKIKDIKLLMASYFLYEASSFVSFLNLVLTITQRLSLKKSPHLFFLGQHVHNVVKDFPPIPIINSSPHILVSKQVVSFPRNDMIQYKTPSCTFINTVTYIKVSAWLYSLACQSLLILFSSSFFTN